MRVSVLLCVIGLIARVSAIGSSFGYSAPLLSSSIVSSPIVSSPLVVGYSAPIVTSAPIVSTLPLVSTVRTITTLPTAVTYSTVPSSFLIMNKEDEKSVSPCVGEECYHVQGEEKLMKENIGEQSQLKGEKEENIQEQGQIKQESFDQAKLKAEDINIEGQMEPKKEQKIEKIEEEKKIKKEEKMESPLLLEGPGQEMGLKEEKVEKKEEKVESGDHASTKKSKFSLPLIRPPQLPALQPRTLPLMAGSTKNHVAKPITAPSHTKERHIYQPIRHHTIIQQPVIQQRIVEQPVLKREFIEQPVHRQIITQPIIHPEQKETVEVQPIVSEETITKEVTLEQKIITPKLEESSMEQAPITQKTHFQGSEPVYNQPIMEAGKSHGAGRSFGAGMGQY